MSRLSAIQSIEGQKPLCSDVKENERQLYSLHYGKMKFQVSRFAEQASLTNITKSRGLERRAQMQGLRLWLMCAFCMPGAPVRFFEMDFQCSNALRNFPKMLPTEGTLNELVYYAKC